MPITNEQLANFEFLSGMYDDEYYPDFLVDKGKQILIRLCEKIEEVRPEGEEVILALTHTATEEFSTTFKRRSTTTRVSSTPWPAS